jgi:DNA polymerase-3 subunit delta'
MLAAAPYAWHQKHWNNLCQQRQEDRLSHAYLVCGDSGLGKYNFALSFARLLLCQSIVSHQPCGTCRSCRMTESSQHPDLRLIGTEEGSRGIGIDQIRALLDFVTMTSHAGGSKIVILEQADSLNQNAANALLKTLEEPTPDTFILLITDAPGTLLPTLRSRCQRLNFTEPTSEVAKAWLEGVITDENIEASLIASGNRPLLALSMLEGGHIESRTEILQSMNGVLCRQLRPEEFIKLAAIIGELRVMGHLSNIVSILIKYLLTKQRSFIEENTLGELPGTFERLTQNQGTVVKDLLVLYDEIELAKRQLPSASNPNPQLIMESLIWNWFNLQKGQGQTVV